MAAAAILGNSAASASVSGTLVGEVVDGAGAKVRGAYVLIHSDPIESTGPAGISDLARSTDKFGLFSVPLQHGLYDVCVMAAAFAPQCRKVQIKDRQTFHIKLTLKVDRAVSKLIEDKVY